jgi:hypothetical protein
LALNANFIILGSCYRRTINLPAIIRIVSVQTEYLDEYSMDYSRKINYVFSF